MLQRRRISTAQSRPVWALLLTASLVASAAVGIGGSKILHTQGEGIAPVAAAVQTASFADGTTTTVSDPAVAGQGGEGAKAVKEFTRDDEFSMFALTWQGQKDVVAHFRGQRADGSWTQWFDAEPASETQASGKNGTELIYIEPTHKVQVQLLGADLVTQTDADAMSQGLEAVFIDGKSAAAQPTQGGVKLMADSDGMPRIISRAGWGADESIRKNCQPQPEYTDPTNAIVIHHTAGSNNYTEQQSAGIVRGIYAYHGQTLGWCDVGYQSLVDKYGNIFEGRFGGINKGVYGAHAGGFNENTWAISMMGDYSSVQPSAATIQSVGELAGWRAKVAGFDPTGSDVHTSEGSSYTKFPYGQSVTLPNIFAHRDVGTTTCPGDAGYAQMGNIRRIAKQKYDSLSSGNFSQTKTTTSTTTKQTAPQAPAPQNPAPKDPVAQAPAPQNPAPKPSDILGTINAIRNGDTTALITAAGTIFGLVLTYLAGQGKLPGFVTVENGTPKIAGISLASIPGTLNDAQQLSTDSDMIATAQKVLEVAGPVLGKATGPVQYAGENSFQKHENGMVVKSPSTGAHAVWGGIGDAWAQQGFDAGPLGLPLNEEYAQGTYKRVDFEHGYITYDPATNKTEVHTQ